MSSPTRFEIVTPLQLIERVRLTSVTTILGKTASAHAKKMLNNWNLKNLAAKNRSAGVLQYTSV